MVASKLIRDLTAEHAAGEVKRGEGEIEDGTVFWAVDGAVGGLVLVKEGEVRVQH